MLVEYKITFQGSSVTITQRIEPDAPSLARTLRRTNGREAEAPPLILPEAHQASAALESEKGRSGGGFAEDTGEGGNPFGGGDVPIVILGAVVIGSQSKPQIRGDAPDERDLRS
jgi:hypothetical protein